MGKIQTANDCSTRVQFVQVHNLYKKGKAKSFCPWMFFYDGEVIQTDSLFQSIQKQGVGSVVRHIQGPADLLSCQWTEIHLQWLQATQNVNRCKQSAVLSSDVNAIRKTLTSLLLIQFLPSEGFGKLCALLFQSEKLILFRFPSGRIKKQIYILNKGENIISNSLTPSEYTAWK